MLAFVLLLSFIFQQVNFSIFKLYQLKTTIAMFYIWLPMVDSNYRPLLYRSSALPTELIGNGRRTIGQIKIGSIAPHERMAFLPEPLARRGS